MATATLTAKGQVVIPVEIRERYGLIPGTRVEFVDDGGTIRLVVRRPVARSDPAAGYGMVQIARRTPRRLTDFDAADLVRRDRGGR